MTTWVNIPDSVIEPAKPIRAIDVRSLRDNVTAMAHGAAGAPRIETDGINDLAVTTGKIADLNVTEGKMAAAAISRAKVKTATNSVSFTASSSFTIALDDYAFFPDIRTSLGSLLRTRIGSSASASTPGFSVFLPSDTSTGVSVAWRYIAA